jgi:hypothetical protein
MTKEYIQDTLDEQFLSNPPRWSGYSITQEELALPGTDPAVQANWVSPSTNVVTELGDFLHLFDYTTNPGSVTYIGTNDVFIECVGDVSMTASAGNIVARFKWSKNGDSTTDSTRYLERKIGNGSDVGMITCTRMFEMSTGDYVDFFFGCDSIESIFVEKAEWKVKAIANIKA